MAWKQDPVMQTKKRICLTMLLGHKRSDPISIKGQELTVGQALGQVTHETRLGLLLISHLTEGIDFEHHNRCHHLYPID